jgi:LmbE family N-acetylglucosaminyl deacetylase
MRLTHASARMLVPDGRPLAEAMSGITHVGIGAHPDDLEFMALAPIAACHSRAIPSFLGITCTDGAGSVRNSDTSPLELAALRAAEQESAARIGRYAAMIQLAHPSSTIQDPATTALADDLTAILSAVKPHAIHTHNPADKHPTHLAVFAAALKAIRSLPAAAQPHTLIGCEVWRDLDWLPDEFKVLMDTSPHEQLAQQLNAVFTSQTSAGKRYDIAVAARRRAHATFHSPHHKDDATSLILGMDLTPLLRDTSLHPADFTCGMIRRFEADVRRQLENHFPS